MRLTEMEPGMRKQRAGNIFRTISTLVLAVMVYGSTVCPAQAAEVILNPAQREYLNTLINHQLRGQSDRDYVQKNWTEAQRVAEFICRPLGQQFVKQAFAGVDKVILDQGAKNTQHLRSVTLLTGTGQYRTGNDWTPFHYECVISGQTGEALEFRLLSRDILTMAPEPVIPGKSAH